MRLAVSNIAWDPDDRLKAYELMQQAGFTGLEIAPSLLFSGSDDPFVPTEAELKAARAEIESFGLTLVSMQSLLFGVEGASLFGDEDERTAFVGGLERAVSLAARLEIPNLVMGSPKQRLRPDGLDGQSAMDQAAAALEPVATSAGSVGAKIAMECNPVQYGANFLTTPQETLEFVRHAAHPAISLNFDIGALFLTQTFDDVERLLREAGGMISHVHVSEPDLAPAPADPAETQRVFRTLTSMGYDEAVSIEMRQPEGGLAALDEAINRMASAYGGAEGPD